MPYSSLEPSRRKACQAFASQGRKAFFFRRYPSIICEGKTMWKKLIFVLVILCVLMPRLSHGQEAKAVLDGVAKAMGDMKSLQYTGSGSTFAVGQNPAPGAPWPRFNAKSYTRMVNYDTASMRDEIVRTQVEPVRGGGGQPVVGEQRQILMVSGNHAWGQVGENINPALAAVADRQHQL